MMKLITALIFLGVSTSVSANPFPNGKELDGQALFIKHDCNQCHIKIMRGDGNTIFTRLTRKVTTPSALLDQIGACSNNVNAHFTPQEKQDLAAYLNRYYKFK